MTKDSDTLRKEGLVLEALPANLFKVQFPDGEALGYLSGRMRMNHIRVLPGDKVDVEFSPYDMKRGRIVRRF